MNIMLYRGSAHKEMFQTTLATRPNISNFMLTALFLLTADKRLWSKVRSAVSSNNIDFSSIKLGDISTNAYALFMIAKDLYCSTHHITVTDLADRDIVPQKLFAVICNAIAIHRYGRDAIRIAEKEGGKQ